MQLHEPFDSLDWDFLELNQGFRKQGYVPKSKNDYSGVTIATGVDLRFQSAQELRHLGLQEQIIQKLQPYMVKHLMGDKARQFLKQNGGLILTQEQAITLNKRIRRKYYNILKDILSQRGINIDNIPIFIVTVLYNRVYHTGTIKNTEILDALQNQKYQQIANLIRNPSSQFKSRLERQASYIEKGFANE